MRTRTHIYHTCPMHIAHFALNANRFNIIQTSRFWSDFVHDAINDIFSQTPDSFRIRSEYDFLCLMPVEKNMQIGAWTAREFDLLN